MQIKESHQKSRMVLKYQLVAILGKFTRVSLSATFVAATLNRTCKPLIICEFRSNQDGAKIGIIG
jgi:hypothetical protein